MKSDYTVFPPRIASTVEVAEQRDGEHRVYVVGSPLTGRYLLLRATEYKVLQLLEGSLALPGLCEEFKRRHNATLPLATLQKFIAKLDATGILAGERTQWLAASGRQSRMGHYPRFTLFNPDRLFSRMVPVLSWVWTPGFVVVSLLMMISALMLSLMNWAEVTSYSGYVLSEHHLAVFVASTVVVFSHEFAHGLTCKAFGGRTPEVGVLMIFYFVPALYCNVSSIHLISERNRRLWVIAAGVYWQVLVGITALLAWFTVNPYTFAADFAFAFFLGSVLGIVFNANPLIKLDGYYFLSQLLGLPNLMDRSRDYWRGLWHWLLTGERGQDVARQARRERATYAAFGLLSFLYTMGLVIFIVTYVGQYLIDSFRLPGLFLGFGVAFIFVKRPLKAVISVAALHVASHFRNVPNHVASRVKPAIAFGPEAIMEARDQALRDPAPKSQSGAEKDKGKSERKWLSRRRIVPLTILLLIVAGMLMPWDASVGSYGTLIAVPGQEAMIHAPESATLIELRCQPGDVVANGAVLARLGNIELEEQLVQVQSELARAGADYERLQGELRAREESVARAQAQLLQRQHDYDEIEMEQRQITNRRLYEADEVPPKLIAVSASPMALTNAQPVTGRIGYPAALAALQSEVSLRRVRLEEANTQLERARRLFAQGVIQRAEVDAAETRSSTLEIEMSGARDRLEAAVIEHGRKHASTATEMSLARSEVNSERLNVRRLGDELIAMRKVIGALEQRRNLLKRRQAHLDLVTPRAGAVFGEDLPRMVGQYFEKGAEICRVADTRQLLVRIQVPENEIGEVQLGDLVRLKTRSFPDRIFRGVVSKIGGETEMNEHNQRTYRVELTIENSDGALRCGMTAFARIDYGRQMIGRILLHKIKQSLRPELWML